MADSRGGTPCSASNAVQIVNQQEKPNHYSYLKDFRVEQCASFLQHNCKQHRPFTCFHWHFPNQRRRRPIRKRDGTFNYSPDEYCSEYNEDKGICPNGDECPYLHRTAGDTERRYHLRYYKTAPCVHDTDARGHCTKNGIHCAFAHGDHDLRNPVYDIHELRGKESGDSDPNGLNVLDKERNLLNDDPKWQDTNYVLACYKTEPCQKPPRLCRQGYACPYYHNTRDRRRNPKKFKYRSTPCPNAKQNEEWSDPSGCENGDSCQYCHTRTEQQFHPEIYKSTKCHDMQSTGYCPRGSFCAFDHGDCEVTRDAAQFQSDTGTNLADLLSNALPATTTRTSSKEETPNGNTRPDQAASSSPKTVINTATSSVPIQPTPYNRLQSLESGELSSLASSGPTGPGSSSLCGGFGPLVQPISKPRSLSVPGSELNVLHYERMLSLDHDEWETGPDLLLSESKNRKSSLYNPGTLGGLLPSVQPAAYFGTGSGLGSSTLDSMLVGGGADDSDEPFKEVDYANQPSLCESIAMCMASASSGLLGTTAPVNIPRSGISERHGPRLTPSPPAHVSLLSGTSFFNQLDSSRFLNRVGSSYSGPFHDWGQQPLSLSPNGSQTRGPSNSAVAQSPLLSSIGALGSVSNQTSEAKISSLEDHLAQTRKTCEVLRAKCLKAERERDEALSREKALQMEVKQLRESLAARLTVGSVGEQLRNSQL